MSHVRALSLTAAAACESAPPLTDSSQARCRCRCGGAAHGARRLAITGNVLESAGVEWTARSFFESLPAQDPHHIPTRGELRAAKNARRRRPQQQALPGVA